MSPDNPSSPQHRPSPAWENISDYAMAFDLLGSLGEVAPEESVIKRIIDFFRMMTGAETIAYLPTGKDMSGLRPAPTSAVEANRLFQLLSTFSEPYRLTEGGGGFLLTISADGNRFGTLLVDAIEPQRNAPHYLNLAINLCTISALVITNARRYETVYQAELRLEETIALRTRELRQTNEKLLKEIESRQRAEEYLRKTEDLSLVMRTHVGLDGRWLKVPQSLCNLLGYTEAELLSKTFKDMTHPADFLADWNKCQKLIRGEIKSFDLEKRYLTKDGKIVWVYLSCSIVRDERGTPLHFVTYISDITSRKEIERERNRVTRMKDEFLTMAAHELRTPLTPIRGYAELLATRNNLTPDQVRKFGQYISKESESLAAIINDLLDVSRIESGEGFDLTLSSRDFLDLVKSELAFFSDIDKEHRFDLSVTGENKPLFLDPDKIRQVLHNLISNAIKYSPAGSRVDIQVEFRNEEVSCRVIDRGIGMNQEQLPHLFEKFYRADKSGKIPGTGLGMVIVKSIIDLHKGEIRVESKPGLGTTMEFTLPAAPLYTDALPPPRPDSVT